MEHRETLTSRLLSKEVIEQNRVSLAMVDFHSKVFDIIERTHLAMGKKSAYRIASCSTKNQKLNTNAYASTY